MKKTAGLSLIELVITVALIGALSAIVAVSFHQFQRQQIQKSTVDTIISMLDSARANTLSARNLSQFGVHFSSSAVVSFEGGSYVSGAAGNATYTLDTRATLGSISLNGGGTDVIFSRLTGDTNNYGTLNVIVTGLSPNKTLTISGTGIVSSN